MTLRKPIMHISKPMVHFQKHKPLLKGFQDLALGFLPATNYINAVKAGNQWQEDSARWNLTDTQSRTSAFQIHVVQI